MTTRAEQIIYQASSTFLLSEAEQDRQDDIQEDTTSMEEKLDELLSNPE